MKINVNYLNEVKRLRKNVLLIPEEINKGDGIAIWDSGNEVIVSSDVEYVQEVFKKGNDKSYLICITDDEENKENIINIVGSSATTYDLMIDELISELLNEKCKMLCKRR